MIITLSQIRAARALLEWNQDALAKAAGISLPTINNLERGQYAPRPETLRAIQSALESAGVVFLENNGVALPASPYQVRTLEGPHFIAELDQDILACLKGPEDELLALSHNERNWITYSGVSNAVYLTERAKRQWGERMIVPSNIDYLTSPVGSYRALPEGRLPPMTIEIYGNRYALIEWEAMRVTIIVSDLIANSQRVLFNQLWDEAVPLTPAQLNNITLYDRTRQA